MKRCYINIATLASVVIIGAGMVYIGCGFVKALKDQYKILEKQCLKISDIETKIHINQLYKVDRLKDLNEKD